MLGNLLTAGCLFSLNMIILVLAGLLRMLPSFLKFIRNMIRAILNLSIRFYKLILTRAAPTLGQYFGINILKGFARIISSILISLVIGLIILTLLHLPINALTVGICILHGLIVGLVWDGISSLGNLNLGDHLE
jgi:hypothetical protein